MNKFWIFISGMFTMGIILDVIFSYKNIGTVDQRVLIFVLCLLGLMVDPLVNAVFRLFAKGRKKA